MDSRRRLPALTSGLGLSLGLLLLLGSRSGIVLADPGTLYVAPGSNCGGATPCYASVQAAVDAAGTGDLIKVAQGTYSGVHNVPSLNSDEFTATQVLAITTTVTIRGGYNVADWAVPDPVAYPTILDGQGQGRVLCIINSSPTIEGLSITGGNASGLGGIWWGDVGGGAYVNNAGGAIADTLIYGNTAEGGGGLFLFGSTTALRGCLVSSNSALGNVGGGICLQYSPAILEDNTITGNTSNVWGGGMYAGGAAPQITSNVIQNNTVTGYGFGGGVALSGTEAALNGNLIADNSASVSGGGVYVWDSNATLDGDIVQGNSAGSTGGGLYVHGMAPSVTNGVITDNTLTGGSGYGAGIYAAYTAPRLAHLTIARNSGGDGSGIHVSDAGAGDLGTITVRNTIIADHAVGVSVMQNCTARLRGTLWYGNTANWGGPGSIDHRTDRLGNPAFHSDGYHLTSLSVAVDRGVEAEVPLDVDGDLRPMGAHSDIGADEFEGAPIAWEMVYLPVTGRER